MQAGKDKREEAAFYKNVLIFYRTACTYMMDKINPTIQPVWKRAEVADVKLRTTASWASVQDLLNSFPCLLPSGTSRDNLQAEFSDYQAESDLPPLILEAQEAESQWQQMASLTDHNGALRFKVLSRFMLGVLLIAVSNSACERVFSIVRKNLTDFRGTMGSSTLSAILTLKSRANCPCYHTVLSDRLLKKCKSATSQQLTKE